MADWAIYWRNYRSESREHGEPIINWLTSRDWLVNRMRRGDRIWLFTGGDACGDEDAPYRGYVAQLLVVDGWGNYEEHEPGVPGSPQYRIDGIEDRCILVQPPGLVDSIFRQPGKDPELHIGTARQSPFEMDGAQVAELLTLLRGQYPAVHEVATRLLPAASATGSSDFHLPDEVPVGTRFREGSVQRVEVNRFERDSHARAACITAHGTACSICGFRFGAVYGPDADGYIHVHHVRPLSEAGGEYVVNPVEDLRPVCPNCHAVLHMGGRCRTIEEIRQLLNQQKHAFQETKPSG